MITLYTSGPYFGLPDPSPFVVKAMMLFKMANIPHETKRMRFSEAPKGKVPYIRDGAQLLGDSFFIARHLEQAHGADFSGGYDAKTQAAGWAVARMLEEHFYFLIVYERWIVRENFEKGPRQFFDMAPAPIRPAVRAIIRRKVRKMLLAQGIGRHSDADRLLLGRGDVDAVEALLGDKTYVLGPRGSEADASVFSFLLSAECNLFSSRLGDYIRSRPNIMNYIARIRDQFFPGLTGGGAP